MSESVWQGFASVAAEKMLWAEYGLVLIAAVGSLTTVYVLALRRVPDVGRLALRRHGPVLLVTLACGAVSLMARWQVFGDGQACYWIISAAGCLTVGAILWHILTGGGATVVALGSVLIRRGRFVEVSETLAEQTRLYWNRCWSNVLVTLMVMAGPGFYAVWIVWSVSLMGI